MKHLYLTLTFLLPIFGGTVFAQTGMTVFGDCYVSGSASIGFFGDELTLQSDVKGEGSLVMAGDKPQLLTARNGTIDRLVIANPTVVTLKGKLTVRQSLTVEQGTLDILPLSELRVEQTAVAVQPGGQIRQDGVVIQTGTESPNPTKPWAAGSNAWLTAVPSEPFLVSEPPTNLPAILRKAYQNPVLWTVATPPWWT